MAQPLQLALDTQKISLLKVDGKGWNIALFEDKNTMKLSLCEHCHLVCCDAVELGCDHNDNDICSYCNDCLIELIKENNNRCPIDTHWDPIISPLRSVRRQILKAIVICPYSKQYKQNLNNDNDQIIDTIDGDNDQKEGIIINKNNNNIIGCDFKGTLNDLIENHLSQCIQKYNPSFIHVITINQLNIQNEKLKQTVTEQTKTLNESQQEIQKVHSQINELHVQLQASNQKNTNFVEKIQEQQSTINQQSFFMKEVNQSLSHNKEEIIILGAQLHKLRQLLDVTNNRNQELLHQINVYKQREEKTKQEMKQPNENEAVIYPAMSMNDANWPITNADGSICWSWKDGHCWKAYDALITQKIEEAYQAQKKSIVFSKGKRGQFMIQFRRNSLPPSFVEINMKTHFQCEVARTDSYNKRYDNDDKMQTGNQPSTGKMSWFFTNNACEGYQRYDTIKILFEFDGGIQGPEHYHPGQPYGSASFIAYLPNNELGREALELTKIAWERLLLFTIGKSQQENTIIWGWIQFKVRLDGGKNKGGWPDKGYFDRFQHQLKISGITIDNLNDNAKKDIKYGYDCDGVVIQDDALAKAIALSLQYQ